MDAEKKSTQQSDGREELIKAISSLLDETIAQVEEMAKGEVSFKELKLQSDENGEMASEAKQTSDDFQGLKKEDEKEEEKKVAETEVKKEELEKQIPAELSEAEDKKDEKKEDKKEEKKDEDKKEEKKDEEAEKACKKSEEDVEYERIKGYIKKAMVEFGLLGDEPKEEPVAKSEEVAVESTETTEEPSKDESEELKKALEARDLRIDELTKTIEKLSEQVEKIGRMPVGRKSLTGLKPLRKSEEDAMGGSDESLNKGEVLEKLLGMQRAGDKRVNQPLITKFELTGDPELVRDILTKK